MGKVQSIKIEKVNSFLHRGGYTPLCVESKVII